jgi:hypothetical protein
VNPLHRVHVGSLPLFSSRRKIDNLQVWNGTFWSLLFLCDVSEDFVFNLGHGGSPCPALFGRVSDVTVVSTTGIQRLRICYCCCSTSDGLGAVPTYIQLLRTKLFPASYKSPATAFTFECLQLFHILTLQGKLTGFNYYTSLERLTNNSDVDPPTVSCFPSLLTSITELLNDLQKHRDEFM